MKKIIWGLLSVLLLSATACEKEDDPAPGAITTAALNATLPTGTWRVTYYWDTDHEETASFAGYGFSFGAGSLLTATKTGSSVSGTWMTGTDDSETKLILNFATPAAFAEISDDWHVVEISPTKIRLEDESGGNGGKDMLTFEKN